MANINDLISLNGTLGVDLGLPSGVIWATCNLGADSLEQYGNYYAWGEIVPKDKFTFQNYFKKQYEEDEILKLCDDAAQSVLGRGWHIPGISDYEELLNLCECKSKVINTVKGVEFIGPNGNSLFFPYGGYFDSEANGKKDKVKKQCCAWLSQRSYNSKKHEGVFRAFAMSISSTEKLLNRYTAPDGLNIRPIYK